MPKADEPINLRDLFPELSEQELQGAEENLEAYLQVVLRIFNRIESDPAASAELEKFLAEQKLKKKLK